MTIPTNAEVWADHGHPGQPCSPPQAVHGFSPCRLRSGRDLNLPFEAASPGTTLDLSDALLSGGVVVMSVAIPTLDGQGRLPGIALRFAKADGMGFHPPILLACDNPDELDAVAPLIAEAIEKAKAAARPRVKE